VLVWIRLRGYYRRAGTRVLHARQASGCTPYPDAEKKNGGVTASVFRFFDLI